MAKQVGIIGGMGPMATWAFYGEVIRATLAGSDQEHLHVVIDADPMIPDRSRYLLGVGEDPRPRLLSSARRLVAGGCEILAMPCNTAHIFAEEIRAAVPVPLVDWIEVVADDLASDGTGAVGLLATSGTIRVGMYQRALASRSISTVIPQPTDIEIVMAAIYGPEGVKHSGRASPRGQRQLLNVARRLMDLGASRILLGCTELPLAVRASDDRWPLPTIDPAIVNARELVRVAGARVAPDR